MTTQETATKKTFFYGLDGKPESLNPREATSLRAERVTWFLYDTLVNPSSVGKQLELGLAEKVASSSGETLVPGPPDGPKKDKNGLYVVHVTLRKGVLFHGGGPELDAEIVKNNFEYYLSRGKPSRARAYLCWELVRDIRVVGKHNLVFTLKHPGIHYLSEIPIVNTKTKRKPIPGYGVCPEGTGPFELAAASRGRIVLTKNTRYWDGRPPGNLPRIEEVVFRIIPDTSTLARELGSGNVDFVPSISDRTLFGDLKKTGVSLEPKEGWNIFYLGFRANKSSPFAERWVRKAIAQAIDLSGICHDLGIGSICQDIGTPLAQPASGPLSPRMPGYDSTIRQVSYTPETAKIHLARFTGDKSWRLVFNGSVAYSKEFAEAIQKNLRHVGVTVRLDKKRDFGEVVDAVQTIAGTVMFLYSWHVSAPYPERILMPLFHSKSKDTNLTRYESPAVDTLLEHAIQRSDPALYSHIQQQIVEDAPMIFLYHLTRVAAYTARVKRLVLNFNAMPGDKLVGADVGP